MLKKFNLEGKETGSVELSEELLQGKANPHMVKDYLVALRANARQWSANTQTRREVNHSHQKPHPQKGTGRARQGFLGATQYRGGGRGAALFSRNSKEGKAANQSSRSFFERQRD